MKDCAHCFNQRYLKSVSGHEEPCHHCHEWPHHYIDTAQSMRMAREAVEKFVMELGKNRKAVS